MEGAGVDDPTDGSPEDMIVEPKREGAGREGARSVMRQRATDGVAKLVRDAGACDDAKVSGERLAREVEVDVYRSAGTTTHFTRGATGI